MSDTEKMENEGAPEREWTRGRNLEQNAYTHGWNDALAHVEANDEPPDSDHEMNIHEYQAYKKAYRRGFVTARNGWH